MKKLASRGPPRIRNGGSTTAIGYFFHVIFSLIAALVVYPILCVVIPVALGIRRIYAAYCNARVCGQKSCSTNWPLEGTNPDLLCLIFDGNLNSSSLSDLLRRVICTSNSELNRSSRSLPINWDHKKHRLKNEQDLLDLLNQKNQFSNKHLAVFVVSDFEVKNEKKTLMIISNSAKSNICVFRLQTIMSDNMTTIVVGNIKERIETELELNPKWRGAEDAENDVTFCEEPRSTFIRKAKMAFFGPKFVLSLLLKWKDPLWAFVEGKNIRRKKKRDRTDASDELLEKNYGNDHCFGWTELPNPELLYRTEKLLRASTEELMLSLVAGTMRSFFQQEGVRHPPNIGVCVPASTAEFQGIHPEDECESLLVPFTLPISVEGAIPRLWSVQNQMSKVTEGFLPDTIEAVTNLASHCFNNKGFRKAIQPIYRSHRVHFAFYRYLGSDSLGGSTSLSSILFTPSLAASVAISFVFIQTFDSIFLSVSLCNKIFPDPERFIRLFKDETRRLLEHLSLRLLTLPNSCVIPSSTMEIPEEFLSDPPTRDEPDTLPKCTKDVSLEHLHQLLEIVQRELDGMRNKPQGNRTEYMRKLAALEERMYEFHSSILARLHKTEEFRPEPDPIVEILAPYQPRQPAKKERRRSSRHLTRVPERKSRRKSCS